MGTTIRRIIPGLFTMGNLLCGYLAVINTIEGSYTHAAWWIIIAGIFDALDGKVARLTDGASDFGIEFDSIADVVSFGIAPSVLFHSYIFTGSGNFGYFVAFCFLAAGAYRLARFNVSASTGAKKHFTGMPIPSGAGILASFILFAEHVWSGLSNFDIAVAVVALTSLAMISGFKYETLPRFHFTSKSELTKSVLFIGLIIAIIMYPDEVFFPVGILYLVSGPIQSISVPAIAHVFHKADS